MMSVFSKMVSVFIKALVLNSDILLLPGLSSCNFGISPLHPHTPDNAPAGCSEFTSRIA